MMNLKTFAGLALVALLATGCVERKLMIRSNPEGAPAYVDEEPVGETPAEFSFKHYGRRRIRVGPVVDESGSIQYLETERMVETVPPWYETFPIDFFYEVLWPGTMVDKHEVQIHLPPTPPREAHGVDAARKVRDEAEKYREESLSPVSPE